MLDGTTQGPPKGSPEWWVRRLSRKLDERLGLLPQPRPVVTFDVPQWTPKFALTRWDAYYRGQLNLALASEKWRAEFAARFPAYSVNFMGLVVDNHRQRLQVQGIRYGDSPEADRDAWDWWQDNHMDAESLKLHREMLVKGEGSVLVWPNDEGVPEVSIESALEMVVETAPGKAWRRVAALKRFVNDDGYLQAELYLPDGIYKFRSVQKDSDFSMTRWYAMARWQRLEVPGEAWPIDNPIGIVPVVPFVHKPDIRNQGESKIAPVASSQDAINKLRVDAFVAAEFASFKQRWAIGIDIPRDELGNPIEGIKPALDRLWVIQRNPEDPDAAKNAKFGEFDVTPLGPFYEAIEGEVQMMGAISNTPYHRLLPQSGQPPSADSIRSSEAGLVDEVLDDMVNIGEAHEEVFRLKFLFDDDPRSNIRGAEMIWRPPFTLSESQHTDALVKQLGLGVPELAIWEQMQGVTQSTIRRWKVLKAQQQLEESLNAPAPPPALSPLASPGALPNRAAPLILPPTRGRPAA